MEYKALADHAVAAGIGLTGLEDYANALNR
jgi:hypothetical protein